MVDSLLGIKSGGIEKQMGGVNVGVAAQAGLLNGGKRRRRRSSRRKSIKSKRKSKKAKKSKKSRRSRRR
jgi:hypothetical protein